jgi:hypothetical protein
MNQIDFFKGRRILLITPRFFGYETKIINHLKSLGSEVHFLDERPGNSFLIKGLLRLHSVLSPPLARWYFKRALMVLQAVRFDDVLVISPEFFDERTIRQVRETQPSARIILYMWDSLINKGWTRRRATRFLAGFDRTLSFDDVDAAQYGMRLRPLFYSNTIPRKDGETPKFAFSFIGTIHSDRYRVLKDMDRCAQARGLATYIYAFFPSKYLYWFYRLTKLEFKGTKLADFQLSSLPYDQVMAVFQASSCIVDIEHPDQRGLTMRTLEVIGSGRHLITTNPNIRKYPFYTPERVTVIDRHRATLPDPLPKPGLILEEEKHSLSLHGWCEEIFGMSPQ